MSIFDLLLGKTIHNASGALPRRKVLSFVDNHAGLADNPKEGSTDLLIGGSGSARWPVSLPATVRRVSVFEPFLESSNAGPFFGAGTVSDITNVWDGRIGVNEVIATNATQAAHVRTDSSQIPVGGGSIRFRTDILFTNVYDVTNAFKGVFGIDASGASSGESAHGVCFRYGHGLANTSDFLFRAQNGSGSVSQLCGVVVQANTWYCLEFEINANGTQVLAWINGVLVAVLNSNIPTATRMALYAASIYKQAGASARTIRCDTCAFSWEG